MPFFPSVVVRCTLALSAVEWMATRALRNRNVIRDVLIVELEIGLLHVEYVSFV